MDFRQTLTFNAFKSIFNQSIAYCNHVDSCNLKKKPTIKSDALLVGNHYTIVRPGDTANARSNSTIESSELVTQSNELDSLSMCDDTGNARSHSTTQNELDSSVTCDNGSAVCTEGNNNVTKSIEAFEENIELEFPDNVDLSRAIMNAEIMFVDNPSEDLAEKGWLILYHLTPKYSDTLLITIYINIYRPFSAT